MTDAPWSLPMIYLPIDKINVGTRRREEMGDLDSLAQSIQQYGLLHPIVVDAGYRLIAGHRRLEACKLLGWKKIPIRSVGNVSQEQMRELELRENLDRKDFTELELSKNMMALVKVVKERQQQKKVEEARFRPVVGRNSNGGRPAEAGSIREVAKEIGVPRQTIHNASAHVAAVEKYPELEAATKSTAIRAACEAEKQSDEAHKKAVIQKYLAREDKKIDADSKVANQLQGAVFAVLKTPVSEERIDAWVRATDMGSEKLRNALQDIDMAVDLLNQMKKHLLKHTGMRLVRKGE